MPDQISVSEFLSEATEDYNSPTTSSFTTRLQSCRNSVSVLEEHQEEGCFMSGQTGEKDSLCCGYRVGQPDICGRAMGAEQAPVNHGQTTASNAQHHLHAVSVTCMLQSLPCSRDRLRRSFLPHAMQLFNSTLGSATPALLASPGVPDACFGGCRQGS
ncbi:arf-GAP with SH3 domain, ANK repeat and PH domain-containing protein 1 isoform X1 [Tachysurus ichikawai]